MRNENTSRLFAVDVRVGAVPPDHVTAVPHVTERGVPSAVNIRVNADEPTGAPVIVSVDIPEFKETKITFELVKLRPSVPPLIPALELISLAISTPNKFRDQFDIIYSYPLT